MAALFTEIEVESKLIKILTAVCGRDAAQSMRLRKIWDMWSGIFIIGSGKPPK
jgi:hypothetical protein